MSNQDGTGPRGEGPLTGRGMGYCVVPLVNGRLPVRPNFNAPMPFYPCGRGRGLIPCGPYGRGRGFGRNRY